MFDELSKLKTPTDWGSHQFNVSLSSAFAWYTLGEQHCLASKVLLMECWYAKNELYTTYNEVTEFGYGTKEFDVLQKTYFYEPATLLFALSFENFLKGIWLKQNSKVLNKTGSFPKLLKTHDSKILANKCEIELTKEEEIMLKVLTLYSTWRGKYIIPLNQEENIELWESKYPLAFLLKKYPGDFIFPDEVKSL